MKAWWSESTNKLKFVKWVLWFIIALSLLVIFAMSFSTYYDYTKTPIDTYENVTNKLYWYVMVSREGFWLPAFLVMMVVVSYIGIILIGAYLKKFNQQRKSVNEPYWLTKK